MTAPSSPLIDARTADLRESYYQRLVEDLRQQNLRTLSALYSDLYGRERDHAEWIDHGGEA